MARLRSGRVVMATQYPEQDPIPTPEETLELGRALLARSRATLAEVSRRLAAGDRPEGPLPDGAAMPRGEVGPSAGA